MKKNWRLIPLFFASGAISSIVLFSPIQSKMYYIKNNEVMSGITYEKYKPYTDLMTDNYKNLTIDEFRADALNRLFNNNNEKKNQALMCDIIGDSEIRRLRFTEKIPFFLRNVAVPLTSEKWKSNFVEGPITRKITAGTAVAEIKFQLDIKDSRMLIKEYEKVYSDAAQAVEKLLNSKTEKQLKQESIMKTATVAELKKIAKKINAEGKVRMTVGNCIYCIEEGYPTVAQLNVTEKSTKSTVSTTQKEASKLLSLKNQGYESLSLYDFRSQLADKFNQDSSLFTAKEHVMMDLSSESPKLKLSKEDYNFIMITLKNSIGETEYELTHRYKPAFQKQYYVYSKKYDTNLLFEYTVQYSVKDEKKFTVGNRDKVIMSVFDGMDKYIKETKLDPSNKIYLSGFKTNLNRLVKMNSSSNMVLTIEQCVGN